MSTLYTTKGACAMGAVDTETGFTAVTFREDLFKRNICQSASVNCYEESGINTLWGKTMEMAKNVCNYMNGKKLPSGVSVSYF